MKTKNYILFLFLFLPLLQSNAQTVAVRGKQLFVNEQRYRIKAVDYKQREQVIQEIILRILLL